MTSGSPLPRPTSAFLRGQEHPRLAPPPPGAPFDVVFVDRDGTLNVLQPGYRTPADVEFVPDALAAVARLSAAGIPVVLVTNQQGLATGRLTWEELDGVHLLLVEALADVGGRLDDVRLCPHLAGTCRCRKPAPGLLDGCLADNPWIVPAHAVMIGDSPSDESAARSAGVPFVQVADGVGLGAFVEARLT